MRAFYSGWYRDLVTVVPTIENGYILAPQGPGLGTDLLPDVRARAGAVVVVTDVA